MTRHTYLASPTAASIIAVVRAVSTFEMSESIYAGYKEFADKLEHEIISWARPVGWPEGPTAVRGSITRKVLLLRMTFQRNGH